MAAKLTNIRVDRFPLLSDTIFPTMLALLPKALAASVAQRQEVHLGAWFLTGNDKRIPLHLSSSGNFPIITMVALLPGLWLETTVRRSLSRVTPQGRVTFLTSWLVNNTFKTTNITHISIFNIAKILCAAGLDICDSIRTA